MLANQLPIRNFGFGETAFVLRDARRYQIGAGPSELRRMLIGHQVFQETL